jgi:hypothetical protein
MNRPIADDFLSIAAGMVRQPATRLHKPNELDPQANIFLPT